MSDDEGVFDAQARQRGADETRLAGRVGGVGAAAVAPAVARAVDGDDAKTKRGQPCAQRDAQVGLVARGAMQQQNGGARRARWPRIGQMQPALGQRDELSARRESPFEAARAP